MSLFFIEFMNFISFIPGREEEVSRLIRTCIQEVNSKDLTLDQVVFLKSIYLPDGVLKESTRGEVYLLLEQDKVVGTITIRGNQIASVFVDVTQHKKGYGRELLNFAEQKIKNKTIGVGKFRFRLYRSCFLRASDYAVNFYVHLGYEKGKKTYYNVMGNLTMMTKRLYD